MKKILIAAIAMTISAMATNSVEIFKNSKTQVGGQVGNSIVYIYPNNEMTKIKDIKILEKVKESLVQSICGDKDTERLVNKGKNVVFIYPGEEKTSIFTVDSCK